MKVKIKKLVPEAIIPKYETLGASGMDIYATSVKSVQEQGYGYIEYGTGLAFEVPEGYGLAANGCFFDKSRQGFLPEIMERMYNDRVVYKEKMIAAQKEYEATKSKQASKDISRYKNMQLFFGLSHDDIESVDNSLTTHSRSR